MPSRCSRDGRRGRVEVGRVRGRTARPTARRSPRARTSSATTRPATASGRRRNRRAAARRRRARGERTSRCGDVDVAHRGAPDDPDPRVEQRVDDVDEQVDDHVAGRRDEHDPLDQRVVALVDGVDRQPAEAGDAEDLLGDHRAGDQHAELEADHRRHRDQAVAERVHADDATARSAPSRAPCARSRRRASRASTSASAASAPPTARCRARSPACSMCSRFADRVVAERDVAARGQPVQVDREHDDQQQAEPEVRHREPDERDRSSRA